jgi:heat-inducible transcriptional repressor
MSQPDLNERGRNLLKVLIERYIADGQPVGSRTLAKETRIDLSPASIRNVMADLEDLGLIKSPHTSAGRIPTDLGYRLFVDKLLHVKPLKKSQLNKLASPLNSSFDSNQVIKSASAQLSEITGMAGVVMVPKKERITLRQIEFLPLSNRNVLVILVTNEKDVQNQIIHTSRDYTRSELEQAANYLNHTYEGFELEQVRHQLVMGMEEAKRKMDNMMTTAIEMAQQVIEPKKQSDYVMAGQTNLMNYSEMGDVSKLRQIFDVFTQKQDLLHLLDQSVHTQGVQIFIGHESGYEVLGDCSIVTSAYHVDGSTVGVLGVIGPTRMSYDKVIPIVDVTSHLLSSALNHLK